MRSTNPAVLSDASPPPGNPTALRFASGTARPQRGLSGPSISTQWRWPSWYGLTFRGSGVRKLRACSRGFTNVSSLARTAVSKTDAVQADNFQRNESKNQPSSSARMTWMSAFTSSMLNRNLWSLSRPMPKVNASLLAGSVCTCTSLFVARKPVVKRMLTTTTRSLKITLKPPGELAPQGCNTLMSRRQSNSENFSSVTEYRMGRWPSRLNFALLAVSMSRTCFLKPLAME
mmetsp:Transcript_70909/g.217325  ORF Transcript_70909/g.217325 Transcript_70909/m.217325 type:complete len:231 (-) Transcript_70909:788-1480(-)